MFQNDLNRAGRKIKSESKAINNIVATKTPIFRFDSMDEKISTPKPIIKIRDVTAAGKVFSLKLSSIFSADFKWLVRLIVLKK